MLIKKFLDQQLLLIVNNINISILELLSLASSIIANKKVILILSF